MAAVRYIGFVVRMLGSLTKGVFIALQNMVGNFTPIGAACRPCGAKNLKIGF